jgi:hypothetical protein
MPGGGATRQTIGEYPLVPVSYGPFWPRFVIWDHSNSYAMKTMTMAAFNPDPHRKRSANAKEARRRKRVKFSLPVHLRPFDSELISIEDVGQVVDFTQDGLYFVTCMPHYRVGMRLIVTFPFGKNVACQRRFIGMVVRLEERPFGSSGVAVKFLL